MIFSYLHTDSVWFPPGDPWAIAWTGVSLCTRGTSVSLSHRSRCRTWTSESAHRSQTCASAKEKYKPMSVVLGPLLLVSGEIYHTHCRVHVYPYPVKHAGNRKGRYNTEVDPASTLGHILYSEEQTWQYLDESGLRTFDGFRHTTHCRLLRTNFMLNYLDPMKLERFPFITEDVQGRGYRGVFVSYRTPSSCHFLCIIFYHKLSHFIDSIVCNHQFWLTFTVRSHWRLSFPLPKRSHVKIDQNAKCKQTSLTGRVCFREMRVFYDNFTLHFLPELRLSGEYIFNNLNIRGSKFSSAKVVSERQTQR